MKIGKGDWTNKDQSIKNDIEFKSMENNSYSFKVWSLIYPQVCTRPNKSWFAALGSNEESS